jgi:hypothetical protein
MGGQGPGGRLSELDRGRIVVAIGATHSAPNDQGMVIEFDICDAPAAGVYKSSCKRLMANHLDDGIVAQHRCPGSGHDWHANSRMRHRLSLQNDPPPRFHGY